MSKLEDALEDFDMDSLPEEEESMLEWWDFDDPAEMVAAVAGDIQFIIDSRDFDKAVRVLHRALVEDEAEAAKDRRAA